MGRHIEKEVQKLKKNVFTLIIWPKPNLFIIIYIILIRHYLYYLRQSNFKEILDKINLTVESWHLGYGRGRNHGPNPLLRLYHPRHNLQLFLRQPTRDRNRLPKIPLRVVARWRCLRRKCIHLPRTEVFTQRNRVCRFV